MRHKLSRSAVAIILFVVAVYGCVFSSSAVAQNPSPTPAQTQSQGQSLADIARQQKKKQQQQQQQQQKPAAKVYGNEDLANGHSEPSSTPDASSKSEDSQLQDAGKQSAAQWSDKIHGQKQAISSMQEQADKMKESIHYVVANEYTNGVQYNQVQKRNQDQLDRLQQQLASEKKKLEDMQENCRKQGYGSSVCDVS